VIAAVLNRLRAWFGNETEPEKCLQCGLPPGRQFMIATDEPIMHPHQCSWCNGIVYMPGPMFSCKRCSTDGIERPAA
jgi:hypothetical protein